jgi:hypothetical protein
MVQGVAATLQRMITNPIQGPRSTAEPRSVFPAIGELAFSVMAEVLRNLGTWSNWSSPPQASKFGFLVGVGMLNVFFIPFPR